MTTPNSPVLPLVPCEGWWDDVGYGRPPMHELQLRIFCGQIYGSGWDIVGPFTFEFKSSPTFYSDD